ncbi:MAG: DUF1080 domain-containing protein [Planctomycetota bacterium]|nr:DUF1080 domain-containing protein [Planctomycetota bacterium]
MTSRRAFLFRFTLLIATVILAMPAHRSPAADTDQDPFSMHAPVPLIGRWDVTVEGPDGSYPSWFEVQQSGYRTLVGSYVGQFGSSRPVSEVTFDGEHVRFAVPPQWERRTDNVVYEGTLDGETIRGETNGEDGQTVRWTATRAPDLDRHGEPVLGRPVVLFDGKSLAGWKPQFAAADNGWEARDGLLANKKPGNNLITEATFDDFELTLSFRYPKGSNSGIYLRGRYEVQVEDSFGTKADSHRIGGVYGFLTPSLNAAKAHDEWQEMRIRLVGRTVTIHLNGERIIDRQEIPGITGGALDSNEGEPGPIMLQGDHGPVEYRDIVITPISIK